MHQCIQCKEKGISNVHNFIIFLFSCFVRYCCCVYFFNEYFSTFLFLCTRNFQLTANIFNCISRTFYWWPFTVWSLAKEEPLRFRVKEMDTKKEREERGDAKETLLLFYTFIWFHFIEFYGQHQLQSHLFTFTCLGVNYSMTWWNIISLYTSITYWDLDGNMTLDFCMQSRY